jgi:hypothetical protein
MAFASNKNPYAICDRCGFRYFLKELRKEWNGLKTCPECYEPKHPQLEPRTNVIDPQAVREPRPDNSVIPTDFIVRTNVGLGIVGSVLTTPTEITSGLGTITISGATGTTPSPSPSPTPSPTPAPTPSPSITTYTVTVANYYGANYYYIDGSRAATLSFTEGNTYKFDQSDSTNNNHPLRFSTTSNGSHAGGSEYTTGVTTNGTPGSAGAYTQIEVASGAPTLYYYCTNHSGMGGTINTN